MSDCCLRWEMSSAILFLTVLFHCDLMPRGKLINKWIEETSKQASNLWSFARVKCPRQCRRVVSDVDGRCPNNMESGTVVDDHCHKRKDIDRYKLAITVVAPGVECMLNKFIWETNVPPESQFNWESSSAFQGAISNCHSKRRTRD